MSYDVNKLTKLGHLKSLATNLRLLSLPRSASSLMTPSIRPPRR